MSRIRRPSFQKSLLTHSGEDLPSALKSAIWDQQSQARQASQVVSNGRAVPRGMKSGDIAGRLLPNGGIGIGISDSRGTLREALIPSSLNGMQPDQSGAGVPTVAHFPADGQFGWYEDTSGPTLYLARNRQGTILKVALT